MPIDSAETEESRQVINNGLRRMDHGHNRATGTPMQQPHQQDREEEEGEKGRKKEQSSLVSTSKQSEKTKIAVEGEGEDI